MAHSRNLRDYRFLEQQIQRPEYEQLRRGLQQNGKILSRFSTWADVVAFMRNGNVADPRKDEVLRPILLAHKEDRDPRWRTILLVMFWPGLQSIWRQKRQWDGDGEELWHGVIWTFLEVIFRIDPAKRPHRLARKILNDSRHHFHDEYRLRWDVAAHETQVDPDHLVALAAERDEIDLDAIAIRQAQGKEIERLKQELAEGVISEPDFHLMVGRRVYGRPLRDCSDEVGIGYEVAKKRHQRIDARLGPWAVNRGRDVPGGREKGPFFRRGQGEPPKER